MTFLFFSSCYSIQYGYTEKEFDFFEYKDTFSIEVVDFYEMGNLHCFQSGGFPYALIVGKSNLQTIQKDTISVLAICDTNHYYLHQKLMIKPLSSSEVGSRFITKMQIKKVEKRFYKRKILGMNLPYYGKIYIHEILGAKFPVIAGQVIKESY